MTFSESWDLIKKCIWLRDGIWKFGYNTAPNARDVYAEIIALFVANITANQVDNELDNVLTSIESVRVSLHDAIITTEDAIGNAFVTLSSVMAYASDVFDSTTQDELRRFMNIGYTKTGTGWVFTNGNTALPCGDTNGAAVAEFVVGQKVYLEGDDPADATEIAVIVNNDSLTLVGGGYLGTGGAGLIKRPETVFSRNIVRGAATALTNNDGDGVIDRYYTDELGYETDTGIAGITKYECIRDSLTGATENVSVFQLTMTGQMAKDHLDNPTATTDSATLSAITTDDNAIVTDNMGFNREDGAAGATTKIPGWTCSDHTKFTRQEELTGTAPAALAYTYKKRRGTVSTTNINGIGYGLEVSATAGFDLVAKKQINKARLTTIRPYFARVQFIGEVAAAGGVYLEIRDSADNVLAQSAVGAIGIAFGTLIVRFWIQNVDASPLYLCLVRKTVGTGIMYFSNLIFDVYNAPFNGCWQKAFQGQSDFLISNPTDRKPDGFLATDTIAAEKIIQRHVQDVYPDYYLPHDTVGTILEPT